MNQIIPHRPKSAPATGIGADASGLLIFMDVRDTTRRAVTRANGGNWDPKYSTQVWSAKKAVTSA